MTDITFLFPGQASQYVGMGRDLCEQFPEARSTFDEADDVLDMPLSQLCFEGPEEELRQTSVTQPAVFAHSMAAWRVIIANGGRAVCVAGHSLGEYAAIVAAGCMDFVTGLRLVRRRGELMQEAGALRPGAMTAIIGLDDARVEELCVAASVAGTVVPANYNAPGQLVVSGEEVAVARLGDLAKEAGAKRVIPLAVSGAFHSALMQPAASEMADLLSDIALAPASIPIISNVTARPTTDPAEIRQNLIDQMTQPVRWVESIQQIRAMGVDAALEVGPGAVLKGLARRIDRELSVLAAGTADELEDAARAAGSTA